MSTSQAILISRILDKTKHLIKECDLPLQPYKQIKDIDQQAGLVLSSLDEVIKYVMSARRVEEQYSKLEEIVQKLEAEVRKHVGIEMQLKLYGESIQQQLEESEAVRSQFLESTRVMLADYKRSNQFLADENRMLRKLGSEANTRTLRYSLTKGDIIRSSEQATSNKTRNKKIDLKQIASRRYLKTDQDQDVNRRNIQSSSIPKNLEAVDIKIQNQRVKNEHQTDRVKKLRRIGQTHKTQMHLNSSYNQLYESKAQDFYRNSYQYKKAPKRRSIKKSSLSSRIDESQQDYTAPKFVRNIEQT